LNSIFEKPEIQILMGRIRISAAAGMLLLMTASCIDKDLMNISDSMNINSRYSLPIGTYTTNINPYLESLDTLGPSSGDSLYYEDVLYPVNESYIDFTLSDTLTFNLIKDPTGKVKSVEFVILVTNGYPTPALAQVYFMAGSSAIDSAFISGPRVIYPAPLNSEGYVSEPFTTLLTISMPEDFNDKLSSIDGIMVKERIYLTRPDIRWVKFLAEYQFSIHIGARIELFYNTNDL
jgi:hypothetical protein